jgi:hypothetical protein
MSVDYGFFMAKSRERIKARELRKSGESIKVIAQRLNVSVSSVSLWCNDIALTREQTVELEKRMKDPFYGKRLQYSLIQQQARIRKIELLRQAGIAEVSRLTKRELFLSGVVLYWAEGFKKDSQAGLACADPKMILLFIKWLSDCCNYSKTDLSFRVTLNNSHAYRIKEVEDYWIEVTGANRNQFQKTYLQHTVWKKLYERPDLYHGILRVKVRKSTDFLRKINGWIEGVKLNSDPL